MFAFSSSFMPPVDSITLLPGQKIYFASDFHLGTPTPEQSRTRERAVVAWLEAARTDAAAIFLVGDVFDFWFEYKRSIPKGFSRLQGKLAELTDAGIPITLFTGNHDMWMSDYFTTEMGIPVYREPRVYDIGGKRFYIGHGDGLGPGDRVYKQLKKVFESSLARWMFRWLHPDIGIAMASAWSQKSRISSGNEWEQFLGEGKEWLFQYSQAIEKVQHHDFYIFGHRHLPLDLAVGPHSRYINIGEWVYARTYGVFDGETMKLLTWN